MLKRGLLVIIIGAVVFSLYACSSPEADKTDNIADDGIKGIKPPEGCEVIENIEDFELVTTDQSYNRETDANNSFNVQFGGTDTGETLYVNINRNWFIYCDKRTGNSGLLCGKPDCEHSNSNTCNATVDGCHGAQYYKGYLYSVKFVGGSYNLIKISTDGSERELLGKLSKGNLNGGSVDWIIHRGYIYYCYRSGASGTEDVYYNNNSNCIFRKSLEKDSEPECIIALPVMSPMGECNIMATGSYVYMIIPTAEETRGWLYRYNIESGKLEWFKEWGNEIANVAVYDNKIYYSEHNRSECKTKVYCYNTETKETTEFFEIDGLAGVMKYDEDYMYITYQKGDEVWKMGAWNRNGEYVAELPCYNGFDEECKFRDLAGSDEHNIYIWCMVANPEEENIYTPVMGSYTVIEYIEKQDILDGEYEIKEWSEMAE